jgi:hypothetical protein
MLTLDRRMLVLQVNACDSRHMHPGALLSSDGFPLHVTLACSVILVALCGRYELDLGK